MKVNTRRHAPNGVVMMAVIIGLSLCVWQGPPIVRSLWSHHLWLLVLLALCVVLAFAGLVFGAGRGPYDPTDYQPAAPRKKWGNR